MYNKAVVVVLCDVNISRRTDVGIGVTGSDKVNCFGGSIL